MKIRYLGHACFEVTSQSGVKVITDPYTKVGYELPKGLTADILTISHGHFDHNFTQAIDANHLVNKEGEYSIEGVEIRGVLSYHDAHMGALRGENVIYIVKMDGVTLCHMGDIGEECSEELAEEIGKIDVLFIPVGGTYTVDALGAKKHIERLQPKVVIPMHYKPEDGALDIADAQSFLNLYPTEKVIYIDNGVVELDEKTKGIIYMKRVKNV
jgi:L-ascorbate metabolism protein UlaG (beta-lactamase superfamily)